ncbi:MAG: GGDEF domain-containing protein [Burkholderiaceae bacterium]
MNPVREADDGHVAADAAPAFRTTSRAATTPADPAGPGAWDWLLGREKRNRVRVQHSAISFLAYLTGGVVVAWGTSIGGVPGSLYLPWAITLAIVCLGFFALARSRIGLRIHDATFTEIQIIWGLIVINWAYAICGAWRSSALLPMILVINFGTLTLSGRRLMRVTIIAILSLAATIALLHHRGPPRHADLWIDLANLAFVIAITPCAALLSARVGGTRRQLKIQRLQLERALARIEEIAILDPLTGLPNRRHMLGLMAAEIERQARGGAPFTIALIDLDRFKQVNDSYGHGRGDTVLRGFADIARTEIRENDVLARWGGEEFLLLAPNTDCASMRILLERIRAALRTTAYEGLPADFHLTISVGVASATLGEPTERLIERADEALYRAKRLGRDRIEDAGELPVSEAA